MKSFLYEKYMMEKSAVVARATSADFSMIRFSLYNCFYYDYSVEKCSGMTIISSKNVPA